jgi:hypothetical protein
MRFAAAALAALTFAAASPAWATIYSDTTATVVGSLTLTRDSQGKLDFIGGEIDLGQDYDLMPGDTLFVSAYLVPPPSVQTFLPHDGEVLYSADLNGGTDPIGIDIGIEEEVPNEITYLSLVAYDDPDGTPVTGTVVPYDVGEFQTFGFLTAIPEPGAWALMLLGTGAIGALLRHRRHGIGQTA